MSTYLKAGISLIDSVRILEKQADKPEHRKVYQKMVYELLKGESLSVAMQKQQDKFPKLLINMVKTSELTGDLTSVLDDMAEYYTSKEETKENNDFCYDLSSYCYNNSYLCCSIHFNFNRS